MNNKLNPNFTQIPNYLFDELMTNISHAELRVLLYVMRRTYGFQKNSDRISISQLMNGIKKEDGTRLDYGTGLSNRAIITAINSLAEKKLIVTDKKHRKTTRITLNLGEKSSLSNNEFSVKKVHTTSEKSSLNLVKKVHTQKKGKESYQKKEVNSLNFLKEIPEEHIRYFTEKYKVGDKQLRVKAEQLYNYVISTGKEKHYKNFKSLLENAVMKDFGKKESDPLNY